MGENSNQKVKNYIKKLVKKILLSRKFKILILVILLLFFMMQFVYVVKKDDAAFKEGDKKNVPYVASKVMGGSIGGENIKSIDGKYSLGSDLNTIANNIINDLKNNEGRLDYYIDKKDQEKYIKSFIQAEIATLYPDISGRTPEESKEIINSDEYNEIQGRIYIYRKDAEGKENLMKYLPMSEFQNKVSSNDVDINQYFTLNENNELLVASVSYSTNNDGNRVASVSIIDSPISYQDKLKNYSMPFDFLWALLVMSDDQDFVYELSKLGRGSEIRITVHDNWQKTTNITDDITTITTETVTQNWRETNYGSERIGEYSALSNDTDKVVTTTTVSEDTTMKIDVTYADTWIAKCENSYERKAEGPTTIENTNELSDFGDTRDLVNSYDTEKNDKKQYQKVYVYEKVTAHKMHFTNITESVEYQEKENKIYEKTDKEKDTPDNFVKILMRYKKAKSNLFSCESWLFDVLEENKKTEPLLYNLKFLFYSVNGKDYGVTEINLENLDIFSDNAYNIGGYSYDIIFDFIASWENGPLYQYINGKSSYNSTPYIYKCITEDKKYYICVADIGITPEKTRNFGFGVCHSNDYGSTFWHIDEYNKQGIDITQYGQLGTKLEVEKVDNVKKAIIQNNKDSVKSQTTGLDLTEFQIDALVAVKYQYGNIGNFVEVYKRYGNTDELRANFREIEGAYPWTTGRGETNGRPEANWKLFHEGKYITPYGEITGTVGSDDKCTAYFSNINLYNTDGSVNKSQISRLLAEEDKIINNHRGYEFFNNGILEYKQCTWWANARASQYLKQYGTKYKEYPTYRGDGGDYYNNNIQRRMV